MKITVKSVFVLFALFTAFIASSTSLAQSKPVFRITLDDDIINPVTVEYISTSIDKAEKENAELLIIELDTPGGLLTSTRSIVKKIMNAKVPIAVFVAPKGARAGSAGVFITLAANITAMAPSTNIGAAHPVEIQERQSNSDAFDELLKRIFTKKSEGEKKGNEAKEEKKAPPETPMEQKLLNDTVAWAAAIAQDRGRNVEWAQKAVTESVSVSDVEALKLGIIDLIAADVPELLAKIDGREVSLTEGKRQLQTKGAEVTLLPKNFRLKWLAVLAHPNIAYILLMLGFYGLLFEFTHPGAIFPGVAGAISLVLAFFGLQVLPTNFAGVALIILAIIMFIAEIKVTSYGLLTVAGVISLLLGSLILFASPYDFMRVSLPIALSFTFATLAVSMFLTFIVVRSRKKHVTTGSEGLVGAEAEVKLWNGKSGKVFIHGEMWDAQSNDELAIGAKVKIVEVNGMTLIVTNR